MSQRKREIHKRTPLTYRKGKQRLRPMTIKQLMERLASAQTGRLKSAIRDEIARKEKLGVVYNAPVVEEAES